MSKAFCKGDYIRYSSNGVCLIEDIRKLDNADKNNMNDFYILRPVSNQTSTIYVPVNNIELTSRMKTILTEKEIDTIIESAKNEEISWIDDRKERTEYFKAIVKRSDQQELLRLINCIYLKKQDLESSGKKLSSVDESMLTQAESAIDDEFSFVLKLDSTQIGGYIREKLNIK